MTARSTPTLPDSRNPALDAWRGAAVLSLLAGHFVPGFGTDAPAWWLNFGRLGVELFFALSGCLIGGILFRQEMPLPEFALRRFARIVPSMWLFLAVAALLTLLRSHDGLAGVLPAALGLLNLLDLGWYAARFGHLWSVCLELQGYLVLGLVAYFARERDWPATTVILVLIAAGWVITGLRLSAAPQLDYYAVFVGPMARLTAMLLAAALVAEGSLARRVPWPVALAAGVALNVAAVPDLLKYTAGSSLLALACARVALAPDPLATRLAKPWLVAFGTASYSIYLWQQLAYCEKGLLTWPVALAVAIGLGFLAHRLWDDRLHRAAARALRALRKPDALAPYSR